METVNEMVRAVDLAGVLANAILGGIAARAARVDLIGFLVLAVISGLGGGMIRDALLQRGTVVALVDPWYLAVAVVGAGIAFLIPFRRKLPMRGLILVDALAVGCWANVGAQKGLDADLAWLSAIALGMITAVGGSMIRDVLLQKTPAVFTGNTLNATSAGLASVVTLVFYSLDDPEVGSVVAILVAATLSLLARKFKWMAPQSVEPRVPRRAKQVSEWTRSWWAGRGKDRSE